MNDSYLLIREKTTGYGIQLRATIDDSVIEKLDDEAILKTAIKRAMEYQRKSGIIGGIYFELKGR